MKTTCLIPLLAASLGLIGCKRDPLILNTRLDPADVVVINAPVLLEGVPIGTVSAVYPQGDQRCAKLAIAPGPKPLRLGTVVAGVSPAGVELDASAVNAGATKLDDAAWLPRRRAKPTEALTAGVAKVAVERVPWLARAGLERNSIVVGVVVLLVLIWVIRDSLVAGLISGVVAWLMHPFLLTTMADLLVRAKRNQAAVSGVGSGFEDGSAAHALENSLTTVFSQLPGPTVLAIACVFIGAYLTIRFFQIAMRVR